MYTVSVRRELPAQHYAVGGDFGPENQPHFHCYRIELRLAGETLDQHGFLVDIDRMSASLETVLDRYRGKMLNDLEAFSGLNPSIEHLARILCLELTPDLSTYQLTEATVAIWESDAAWASYTQRY